MKDIHWKSTMKKMVNSRTPAQPSSKGKKSGLDICSETPKSLNPAISKTPFAKWRRVKATPGSAALLALSSKKLRLKRPKDGACTPRKSKLAFSKRIRVVSGSGNITPVKTLPRKQKEESCAETSFKKVDLRANSSKLRFPNGKVSNVRI